MRRLAAVIELGADTNRKEQGALDNRGGSEATYSENLEPKEPDAQTRSE